MNLDQNFLNAVRSAIHSTWDCIGSDSIQCAEDCDERMDNATAVESSMEPCYMEMYGGYNRETAIKAIDNAIAEHGYTKVVKYLTKNILLY